MITPVAMSVTEWTDQTSLSLEIYGIIPKLDAPDRWRDWAATVIALPGISATNPPDPNAFEDWKAWAYLFNESTRPGE